MSRPSYLLATVSRLNNPSPNICFKNIIFQAEFGDHDPEKHTAEYLKDFPLLPKPLVAQFEVN